MAGDQGFSEGRGGEAILGKYRLIAKLGQGGMADVFLAVSKGPLAFNKLVVVKRHRSQDGEGRVDMFLDEAKLSARLNHPHIVQTYEIGEEAGAYFIVMEYLDGQPLNRVIRAAQRKEPGAEAFTRGAWLRVVADMLAGLHYAHELTDYDGAPLNIVHRDVSPHNVFVTFDGAVKVVDFGIAKADVNSVRTETGILKGKAAYMAPEQATGSKTLDRRADLFAVGVVLWELLAGRRLFEGEPIAALARLVKNDIPLLKNALPDVPPELDSIVTKALAFDPADRYTTAQEMRLDVEAYVKKSGEDVRNEELAAKMVAAFGERRHVIRKQIKAAMDREASAHTTATMVSATAAPPSANPASFSLPSIDDSGRASIADSGAASTPTPQSRQEPTTGSSANAAVVPVAPPSRGYLIGGVGALALVAAGALVMMRPADRAPVTSASPAGAAPAAAGVVRITSNPPAATVRWNGQDLGKTPLSVDLPAGTQTLTLVSPDFQDETLILQVAAGGTSERAATLRRKETGAPGATTSPVTTAAAAATGSPAAAPEPPRRGWRGGSAAAAPPPETVAPAATAAPVAAAPPPSAAPTAAPSAKPKIQVVDDGSKPMVKVNVVE